MYIKTFKGNDELNDKLGISDFNTFAVALSQLALILKLDSVGYHQLNLETSFKAQLSTLAVPYLTKRLPLCIVYDWKYLLPPSYYGVSVAVILSSAPLSGAKCRPCMPACQDTCVANVMLLLYKWWSWTNWRDETLQICDAYGDWEKGCEKIFDQVVRKRTR